jgi:hypothetical protein
MGSARTTARDRVRVNTWARQSMPDRLSISTTKPAISPDTKDTSTAFPEESGYSQRDKRSRVPFDNITHVATFDGD